MELSILMSSKYYNHVNMPRFPGEALVQIPKSLAELKIACDDYSQTSPSLSTSILLPVLWILHNQCFSNGTLKNPQNRQHYRSNLEA